MQFIPTPADARYARVDLTYDQMVTLPSEQIEVVATPGEGKAIFPLFAYLQMSETGDFGGFDHDGVSVNVATYLKATGNNARVLSRLEGRPDFDSLFAPGGTAWLGVAQNTEIEPMKGMTGSLSDLNDEALVLAVANFEFNQDDFMPLDEGGYPDAVLRVNVLYTIMELRL